MSEKAFEVWVKKYVNSGVWNENNEKLSEFKLKLQQSALILILLRAESADVNGPEIKSDKPFRQFDTNVFKGQLGITARNSISLGAIKGMHHNSGLQYPNSKGVMKFILKNCIFKDFYLKVKDLIKYEKKLGEALEKVDISDLNFLIKEFNNTNELVDDILKYVSIYKNASHADILTRVKMRKKFFEVFYKSLQNFKRWINRKSEEISECLKFGSNLPDFKDLLFTEKVYYPSKSKEELFKTAKDVILHAFLCFIGVCKYVYLMNENYGKALQEKFKFSLDNISWSESFIKSLNKSNNWKNEISKLKGIEVISNIKKIEGEKGIEKLIDVFKNQKYYELPDENYLNDIKSKTLEKKLKIAISYFNSWKKQTNDELKLINTYEIISEMKNEDSKFDEKRSELKKNEKNNEINKNLSKKWDENKLDETGKRKSLSQTVDEANAAFEKLKDAGILIEKDNSRGHYDLYGSGGFSENFVKLFIRYLERSFPDLDDCVKIYYSLSTPSERNDKHYWDKIRYLKYASKNNGMIYFVINQELRKYDDHESTGHANLAIICDGEYKLFESSKPENNLPHIFDLSKESKKFKKLSANALGLIQRDSNNCVTITLGYLESLMKQISKNRKEQVADKKSLSSYLSREINKFTTVKLPGDIDLKVLVPTKYVKYFQSIKNVRKLIDYANKLKRDDPDYAVMQNVKDELEKVLEKYDQDKQPALQSLADIGHTYIRSEGMTFQSNINLKYFDKCISAGLFSKDVTFKEMFNILLNIMKATQETFSYEKGEEKGSKVLSYKKLIEEGKVEWMKEILEKSNILKLLAKDNVAEITKSDIHSVNGEIYCSNLLSAQKINTRAQMKRRTETLKIAALVDVLAYDKDAIRKEMSVVREL
ncbi:MAG: hypothetical protein IJG00_01395 [Clostridia bacterium]|nr:hypothetical protein [Clostridia bacterium]